MWGRQRRLWWTSGRTLLTTSHWLSAARLWTESAALNSWGCISQKISPWPLTLHHSPRRPNSTSTFYTIWEQVSLHPSSPHSNESVLISCITVWYGNCSAADNTVDSEHSCKDHLCPSPLSSKITSIVKNPIHPSHSLFQLLPSGRGYWSIRAHSARARSAQQLLSPGCESPRLKSPRSPWTPFKPLHPEPETLTLPPHT